MLKKLLQEEWSEISVETVANLVNSMPRRLAVLCSVKG